MGLGNKKGVQSQLPASLCDERNRREIAGLSCGESGGGRSALTGGCAASGWACPAAMAAKPSLCVSAARGIALTNPRGFSDLFNPRVSLPASSDPEKLETFTRSHLLLLTVRAAGSRLWAAALAERRLVFCRLEQVMLAAANWKLFHG